MDRLPARTVNGRFFLSLLIGAAVCAGALFGLHYVQSGRVSAALLWQANRADEQGRPDRVAHYLSRYLEFVPEDLEERVRLGQTLAGDTLAINTKARQKALYVLEDVLARDPRRHEVRLLVARVALDAGRWDAAHEHLTILQEAGQSEAEVAHLLGRWHEGLDQFAEAEESYARATARDPKRLDSHLRRAYLLRFRQNKPAEADEVVDGMVAANAGSYQGYLNRWHYRADFGLLTGDRLKEASADVARALELAPEQADVLLAAAERDWRGERREEAYARLKAAASAQPTDPRFPLALQTLLMDDNRKAEAESVLRAALKTVPDTAKFSLLWHLATLVIDRGDPSPKEEAEVARLLKDIAKVNPSAAPVDYLQARVYLNQGRWPEAAERLERVRPQMKAPADLANQVNLCLARCFEQMDDPVQQREALSRIIERDPLSGVELKACPAKRVGLARLLLLDNLRRDRADWDEVMRSVVQASATPNGGVDLVLLQAEALAARQQVAEARQLLISKKTKAPKQVEYYTALAALAMRQGQLDGAREVLAEAEAACGDVVDVRLVRMQLLGDGSPAEALAALNGLAKDLEKFGGDDQAKLLRGLAESYQRLGKPREAGQYWRRLAEHPRHRFDARVRLLLFEQALLADDEAGMKQYLEQIKKIEGARGGIGSYGEALRRIWLAKRNKKPDLDEARTFLDRALQQRPNWPAALLALAELEDLRGNHSEAAGAYRKAFKLSESNPLLLGQLLAVGTQRPEEVEQNLRRATLMAETVPEAWVAYVQYLAGRDRAKAEAAIAQAREKLPADKAALTLAPCYEAVGKSDEAARQFDAAQKARPDDAGVLRAVAAFEMRRGRAPEAEALLRRILDAKIKAAPGDASWARSALAALLVAGHDYRRLTEAVALVGLKVEADGDLADDLTRPRDDSIEAQRARARILATQTRRPTRARAAALLEGLDGRQALTPDDRFLLGQLHESLGDWAKARPQFRAAIEARGDNVIYLAQFTQSLLRNNEVAEAGRVLAKLEALQKDQPQAFNPSGVLFIRAQLLEGQGEGDKALVLLKEHAARKDAQPEDQLQVVASLGRQKRIPEALEAIEPLWRTSPPGAVGGASVALLREATPAPTPEQCARVEAPLRAALKSPEISGPKGDVRTASLLLAHLADLLDLQKRYPEAEKQYRLALERDPDNVIALNNLAWLMAQRTGNGAEALPHIEHAIELAGPRPELLDTRAVVYLALKQSGKALADLQRAAAESPTAIQFFHMARAHEQASNGEAAASALTEAKKRGLKRKNLHPVEELACAKLADQLERR